MDVHTEPEACRRAVRQAQRNGKTVGLVPTMGALHTGHLSLVKAAGRRCDLAAVTIFVNPTQFGPNEDFDQYPRPLEKDLDACRRAGVDIVFTPEVSTMYPGDDLTTVHVGRISERLCGAHRPGHFDGVTTIVAKLFNILPADAAFFGEKDYQQLAVIRRMVRDLNAPIEIVGCPTVREEDGLALSSRNQYLSPAERSQATCLSRALFDAAKRIAAGERDSERIVRGIRDEIAAAGPAEIDYVEVVDAASIEPLRTIEAAARICLAVRIGACRLIDNVGVDPPPLSG